MKVAFHRHILEIQSNIKFHEYPSSGKRVVPCGRADRHCRMQFHSYHCRIMFLVNDQRDVHFLCIFLTLYMFRAHRDHHQE